MNDELSIRRKELENKIKYQVLYNFLLGEYSNKEIDSTIKEIINETIDYFVLKEDFEKCNELKKLLK